VIDRSNRNTALASALVDELARAGVRHSCIAPGSRSAPLALAFWREPNVRVWSHVDERCAGFFALGLAQQTGDPVAILVTSGTAGANLHPAVAEAAEARVPLIVITADRPPELRGRGAGQTIDQLKLYGSSARWFCELGVQEADDEGLLHFRSVGARAVAESLGRPPGPVHLNVPLREPLAPEAMEGDVAARDRLALEGRPDRRPLTRVLRASGSADPAAAAAIGELVAQTGRGIVLAGRQRDGELAPAASAFAASAGYPVIAEPTSQLRAGDHDLIAVVAAYDPIFRSLPERLAPELVIRIGDMVTSKAVRLWLSAHRDCRQVVIDPDGAWNEPTKNADLIVRAEPGPLLSSITGAGAQDPEAEWLDAWRGAERAAAGAIDAFLDGLGEELFEPRVHRLLTEAAPPGSTIYVASSMPVRDLESFFGTAARPLRFLANRGANGIDGLVSSGLGAAAATAGRTFVLTGDLGLYHDMNGLLAYRRLGVEATIVVLNNGGGGIFDFLPIAKHRDGYEELFGTPTNLDLEQVATLYGLPFKRVNAHSELRAALDSPGLVDIPLDRARNVELHTTLFSKVTEALGNDRAT
jgi:2-succinyl-5-enolpyruvyl-6-hydroxy-3-cyclohexene-1-carboxylate synthase